MNPAKIINEQLKSSNVKVKFTEKSFEDLTNYDKGNQKRVIASIIKRGITGPLIKPEGLGEPLRKQLASYTKIKLKREGIRIIYRPRKFEFIEMGIIVIGPRKDHKVYQMAISRLEQFNKEMS